MTSMKIVKFSRPPTPCRSTSEILLPPDLGCLILNEPSIPLQMTTNQLKGNICLTGTRTTIISCAGHCKVVRHRDCSTQMRY